MAEACFLPERHSTEPVCVCVFVCECVKPDDRTKTNMEDPRASSGHHQGGGVALTKGELVLKNSGRDRVRDKAEGGMETQTWRRRRRKREGGKAADTLKREVAVCAI